jgi:hypothetical protein
VLLLVAVGLLIAALGTGRTVLAWGSVALSAVVAVVILRRWRRSWLHRHSEPDWPEDELITGAEAGDGQLMPASVSAVQKPGEIESDGVLDGSPPGEEDTDAADLLLVYELTDEVVVVDEQPRYHLLRCRWLDRERAERLPVREARQLGFTPCDRCRPDKALARKHRAAGATTAGS